MAVTTLFTAFGKQLRFLTLGEDQCRIHTMQATNKQAKAGNGDIAVQLIAVHRSLVRGSQYQIYMKGRALHIYQAAWAAIHISLWKHCQAQVLLGSLIKLLSQYIIVMKLYSKSRDSSSMMS